MIKRPTVGIALDSGGAMGGAHIGVLDVLKENGIPIDIIVGSSAGAAVGAFYASGTLDVFKDMMSGLTLLDALSLYADPVFPVSGLFAGKRVRKFLTALLKDIRIEDLPVTYVAVATDLLCGETVPISRGPLVDAVMASTSMPGIFKPVVLEDRLLTDGGVSNPLPLDILTSLSPDITIACNLHSRLPDKLPSPQKRAIIQAQDRLSEEDEDLSSWLIDRMLGTLLPDKTLDRVKSLRDTLWNLPGGIIQESEILSSLKEQLNQGSDRIGALLARTFSSGNKAGTLNIFEVMLSATNIQQFQKNRLMLMYLKPDILIEPTIDQVRALELNKGESTIAEGRRKALEALPKIRALISERGMCKDLERESS